MITGYTDRKLHRVAEFYRTEERDLDVPVTTDTNYRLGKMDETELLALRKGAWDLVEHIEEALARLAE